MKRERKKTRPIGDVSDPFTCPIHGEKVKRVIRKSVNGRGDEEFNGIYYGCPRYGECHYYVTGDLKSVADLSEV